MKLLPRRRSRARNSVRGKQQQRRRLLYETLDKRELLAADVLAVSEPLSFQTEGQGMWEAGPEAGVSENFSHTFVDETIPLQTIGSINDVVKPVRTAYDASMAICTVVFSESDCMTLGVDLPGLGTAPAEEIPTSLPNPARALWDVEYVGCLALGWTTSQCVNGVAPYFFPVGQPAIGPAPPSTVPGPEVPNSAYAPWGACTLLGWSLDQCEDGISIQPLGAEPPALVEDGAGVSLDGAIRFGIQGSVDIGSGSVDVDYPTQVELQILDDEVASGDVFTISTSEIAGVATMTSDFADINASLDAVVHAGQSGCRCESAGRVAL